MFVNDLEPEVTYYCDHHVTWHVLSWNHEESFHVENVCISNVECGRSHTPECVTSLSIRLLVFGQQQTEYSLLIPPTMDHPNHIVQFVWSSTKCKVDCYMV
jgi:hypothetical protein